MHAGQTVIDIAFKNNTNKTFVVNISRRFGKTYWAVTKAMETAIQKPKARVVIGAAFQVDVTEFIIPLFNQVLDDCPATLRPIFNESKKKYRFNNGSEILLAGLDKNANAGRGRYCDLYIFEEAGFISERNLEYVYSSVVMPATMNRKDAKIILISTPPRSPSHPFKEFCDRAKLTNSYVKLTIHDNPMVTPETIEEYKAECLTDSDWHREYMAEFVIDESSAIIPEWNSSLFVKDISKDNFYNFYHKYVGLDLGVRDLTAAIFGYYDFRAAKLIIEDECEINGPEMTTPVLAALIRNKETQLWDTTRPYRRISDNNNLMLLTDLGSLHKMQFIATNKDTLEAMLNEVRMLVSAGRIIINPRCLKLIGCLESGIFADAERKNFARSKAFGHFDHLAALVYVVRNLDKHTNPIPHTYGFDTRNSRIRSPQHISEGTRMLGQIFQSPTRKI